mmetsp:Transcript_67219/g.216870  ORF Transcript_67219/g.216870 Transcript_67219/m.216870 type:complete len:200 (-) Transcript_67219:8-607(-)
MTPQWQTTATVASGRSERTSRSSAMLACSLAASSASGPSASCTPRTPPPPGSCFRSRCICSTLPGVLARSSHQSSLAGRQSCIGVASPSKARQAVCTARRSGEMSTTSAPNCPICPRQELACCKPASVRGASGTSSPVRFCSLWPWRSRSTRRGPTGTGPGSVANSGASCSRSASFLFLPMGPNEGQAAGRPLAMVVMT